MERDPRRLTQSKQLSEALEVPYPRLERMLKMLEHIGPATVTAKIREERKKA